ncbi:hypothetical protein [Chryseobacterium sp.]|uniref:hypothetical protein n=1 Tax=Chryseobacterium sp. TaxID=1871047 RepID=UPI0025BB4109|nr:hypothetical protein [Chryseobacterium sp.]
MRWFSIFFLTLFLSLRPLIPLLDYALNYDYISKVLCVNAQKADLKCNGKCYLAKEMAKTANEENSKMNGGFKFIDAFLGTERLTFQNTTQELSFTEKNFFYKDSYLYFLYSQVIKPPTV